MIIVRDSIWITFVSENTPSRITYNKYYLDVVVTGALCQFKYHNNAVTKIQSISNFKDAFNVVFTVDTITKLQLFLNEQSTIEPQLVVTMFGNNTTTVISGSTNPTKALGTTVISSASQGFTSANNTSEYKGFETKYFMAKSVASITAPNNRDIVAYIAKNGLVISESKGLVTADGNNNEVVLISKCKLILSYGDYIEFWVGNQTNNNNVTVRNLNITID